MGKNERKLISRPSGPFTDEQGIVPIRRVANDNIVICEALSTDCF